MIRETFPVLYLFFIKRKKSYDEQVTDVMYFCRVPVVVCGGTTKGERYGTAAEIVFIRDEDDR